uniref:Uncharacterized protein n=1 Tax=Physcomitrium patens TaxID=3218 RepID=A0A2K1JHK3_PHYPA|nr:hypothetical protein PHYPA_018438 [Physcomitrium patens]
MQDSNLSTEIMSCGSQQKMILQHDGEAHRSQKRQKAATLAYGECDTFHFRRSMVLLLPHPGSRSERGRRISMSESPRWNHSIVRFSAFQSLWN